MVVAIFVLVFTVLVFVVMSFVLVMLTVMMLIVMTFFVRMLMSALPLPLMVVVMLVSATLAVFFAAPLHLHPFLTGFLFGHFALHYRTFQFFSHFRFLDALPPHPGFFFTHHAVADGPFELGGKFFLFEFTPSPPCFPLAHFTTHDSFAEFCTHVFKFILHCAAKILVVLIFFPVALFGNFVKHFHHGRGLLK